MVRSACWKRCTSAITFQYLAILVSSWQSAACSVKRYVEPVLPTAHSVGSCLEASGPLSEDVLTTRQPVVFRGGGWAGWEKDVVKWRTSNLHQVYGYLNISVRRSQEDRFDCDVMLRDCGERTVPTTVSEFLNDDENISYWDSTDVIDAAASLVVSPRFNISRNVSTHRMWITRHNVSVGMHFDMEPNLLLVVQGSKTFHLAGLDKMANVYAGFKGQGKGNAADFGRFIWAPVDADRPDYNAFPLLREADFHICQVNVGDVLFVPSYWYHFVHTETASDTHAIALNWFYMVMPNDPVDSDDLPDQECFKPFADMEARSEL